MRLSGAGRVAMVGGGRDTRIGGLVRSTGVKRMERGNEPETQVTTVRLGVPADVAWDALADPLNFPRLYPRWTCQVVGVGPGFFVAVGPGGERFAIRPRLCRPSGVIDLEIAAPGGPGALIAATRSRIFPEPGGGCLYVHVATRPPGVDDAGWVAQRHAIEADIERARQVLEREFAMRAA